MKIYNISSPEFAKYGRVLDGYDFTALLEQLGEVTVPENGISYVASCEALEQVAVADEICRRGFGSYPVQIGYVTGKNRRLDCLEYHKSSEFNIAREDVILVLGCVSEIVDNTYDTSLCKAFLIPAGVGVELYGTTLHYAPFHVCDGGYRVVCVLPRGTNAPRQDMTVKNNEDRLLFGVNKWLMTHADVAAENAGAYVGLKGENLTYDAQ